MREITYLININRIAILLPKRSKLWPSKHVVIYNKFAQYHQLVLVSWSLWSITIGKDETSFISTSTSETRGLNSTNCSSISILRTKPSQEAPNEMSSQVRHNYIISLYLKWSVFVKCLLSRLRSKLRHCTDYLTLKFFPLLQAKKLSVAWR